MVLVSWTPSLSGPFGQSPPSSVCRESKGVYILLSNIYVRNKLVQSHGKRLLHTLQYILKIACTKSMKKFFSHLWHWDHMVIRLNRRYLHYTCGTKSGGETVSSAGGTTSVGGITSTPSGAMLCRNTVGMSAMYSGWPTKNWRMS